MKYLIAIFGDQATMVEMRSTLLERDGESAAGRESHLRAARITASASDQRYLTLRASRLG